MIWQTKFTVLLVLTVQTYLAFEHDEVYDKSEHDPAAFVNIMYKCLKNSGEFSETQLNEISYLCESTAVKIRTEDTETVFLQLNLKISITKMIGKSENKRTQQRQTDAMINAIIEAYLQTTGSIGPECQKDIEEIETLVQFFSSKFSQENKNDNEILHQYDSRYPFSDHLNKHSLLKENHDKINGDNHIKLDYGHNSIYKLKKDSDTNGEFSDNYSQDKPSNHYAPSERKSKNSSSLKPSYDNDNKFELYSKDKTNKPSNHNLNGHPSPYPAESSKDYFSEKDDENIDDTDNYGKDKNDKLHYLKTIKYADSESFHKNDNAENVDDHISVAKSKAVGLGHSKTTDAKTVHDLGSTNDVTKVAGAYVGIAKADQTKGIHKNGVVKNGYKSFDHPKKETLFKKYSGKNSVNAGVEKDAVYEINDDDVTKGETGKADDKAYSETASLTNTEKKAKHSDTNGEFSNNYSQDEPNNHYATPSDIKSKSSRRLKPSYDNDNKFELYSKDKINKPNNHNLNGHPSPYPAESSKYYFSEKDGENIYDTDNYGKDKNDKLHYLKTKKYADSESFHKNDNAENVDDHISVAKSKALGLGHSKITDAKTVHDFGSTNDVTKVAGANVGIAKADQTKGIHKNGVVKNGYKSFDHPKKETLFKKYSGTNSVKAVVKKDEDAVYGINDDAVTKGKTGIADDEKYSETASLAYTEKNAIDLEKSKVNKLKDKIKSNDHQFEKSLKLKKSDHNHNSVHEAVGLEDKKTTGILKDVHSKSGHKLTIDDKYKAKDKTIKSDADVDDTNTGAGSSTIISGVKDIKVKDSDASYVNHKGVTGSLHHNTMASKESKVGTNTVNHSSSKVITSNTANKQGSNGVNVLNKKVSSIKEHENEDKIAANKKLENHVKLTSAIGKTVDVKKSEVESPGDEHQLHGGLHPIPSYLDDEKKDKVICEVNVFINSFNNKQFDIDFFVKGLRLIYESAKKDKGKNWNSTSPLALKIKILCAATASLLSKFHSSCDVETTTYELALFFKNN